MGIATFVVLSQGQELLKEESKSSSLKARVFQGFLCLNRSQHQVFLCVAKEPLPHAWHYLLEVRAPLLSPQSVGAGLLQNPGLP